MSKKQDFNKEYNAETSVCLRRASRLSKADLISCILEIKTDLADANWVIYQLLLTGELSDKNMRKGVRFLARQGYDF